MEEDEIETLRCECERLGVELTEAPNNFYILTGRNTIAYDLEAHTVLCAEFGVIEGIPVHEVALMVVPFILVSPEEEL